MTEELKPCPFCGGEAALIIPSELVEADCADIYVSCEECEAESQHVVVEMRDRTPDLWPCERRDAIAAWNTRLSHSAEKEALIEALEKIAGRSFRNQRSYLKVAQEMRETARSTLLSMRNNGNG